MSQFVYEFLTDPAFKHPQVNNSGLSYLDYLRKVFSDIDKKFDDLHKKCMRAIPDSVLDRTLRSRLNINAICDVIIEVISDYLSGTPYGDCYAIFEQCLNNNRQYIDSLWSVPQSGSSSLVGNLYRMRECSAEDPLYTPKGMFHVPFDIRNRASSMRFSKPNTPCLYFADNLFVCDAEIRENETQVFQASRYEIVEPIRVLNFGYNNYNARAFVQFDSTLPGNAISDMGIAWLNLYPIALASAIVSPKTSDLPHEYILPQMLMDYIIKNDFDGVRYLSTKVISEDSHIGFYTCWAFPTTSNASTGHDPKLCSKVKVSDPVKLPVTLSGPMGKCAFEEHGGKIRNNKVVGLTEYKTDVQTKIFAEAESELFTKTTHTITP